MNLPSKRIKFPDLDHQLEVRDVEKILNCFPEAALLFNPLNQRILYTNTILTEHSLYRTDELLRMDVAGLLPGFFLKPDFRSKTSIPLEDTMQLVRKDKTCENFHVTIHHISTTNSIGLITMVPKRLVQLQDFEIQKADRLLCVVSIFRQILKQERLEQAVDSILSAACTLTNTNCAGFYQAKEDQPQLKLTASVGSFAEYFPETLPLRELIQKQPILFWNSNTLPASRLQEIAQDSSLPNLTTVLVGEVNASIGLIVLTGPPSIVVQSNRETLSEIAAIATLIIQRLFCSSSLIAQREKLFRENTLFQSIFNNISDAVIILSKELSIIYINQATTDILGYSKDELIDQPIEKILVSNEEILPILNLNHNELPIAKNYHLKLFRRSGGSFPAVLKIVPYFNENLFANLVISIEDHTSEDELNTQVHRLEHQALLGQHQRNFAHEVRNAINSIGAGLQLISRNLKPDDPNLNRIGLIKQDLDSMAGLMETILTFTKMTESEMEELNLGVLLNRILDKYQNKFKQAKIHRHLQVDEDLPPIFGHRRSLEQVFINLIDNASREMKAQGGTLAVKIHHVINDDDGNFIETSIADSGIGIPGEEKDHIFRPYHTTSPTGTGLGLVISKQLVEAHHGEIVCNSFLGGTIFFVRIPVYRK